MGETTRDGMTTEELRFCLAAMSRLPMSDPRHEDTILQAFRAVDRLAAIEDRVRKLAEGAEQFANGPEPDSLIHKVYAKRLRDILGEDE